jgi:hypothetical protein
MLHSLFFLTPCPTPPSRPPSLHLPFTQRVHCIFFCRLYPFSPQLPRQCLGPICHLTTLNYHCAGGAGLPNHMMGEVAWDLKRRRLWVSYIGLSLSPPPTPFPTKYRQPFCPLWMAALPSPVWKITLVWLN